jgi:hypothetical protein
MIPQDEEYDVALMAIDEDEMDDLAMLATEDKEKWVYKETEDGTVKAARKGTGLKPNPLTLLLKGIDAKESKSYLGLDIYFDKPSGKEQELVTMPRRIW